MNVEMENQETGEIEVIEIDDGEITDDDEMWEEVDSSGDDDDEEGQLLHSDAKITFSKHTDAVVTCDLDASGSLAVSGSQDDKAYVWNTADGTVHFQCAGHTDTVISAGFNHDNKLVATADMNGNIKAWSVDSGNQVWNAETSEIVWTNWHHSSNVLLVGTSNGDVWLWAIPSSNCKIFPSHGSEAEIGKFLADGKRALIGYADGTFKLIDLKSEKVLHHFKGGDAHNGIVSAIDICQDNILAVSGGQDCIAKVINTQSNKVLANLICDSVSQSDTADGVESLTMNPQKAECATGTLSGLLGIWDLPTSTQKLTCKNNAGVVRVLWHPTSQHVYCACLDGVVRKWDPRIGEQVAQWRGHSRGILDMAISKNGEYIATASDDKLCSIFTS